MSQTTDTRTASQRIEDLEKVLAQVYPNVVNQANAINSHKFALDSMMGVTPDLALVKEALKLLNKRIEAVVQAAKPESGITPESVSTLLVQMNVADLTKQVQDHLANGHLVPTDVIADSTFLVAEELNSDGTLANPRVQLRLDSQDAETQEALKGKKAGDTASFGSGKFTVKILEVYTIVDPNAAKAETPSSEAQEETPTSAAPAEATPEVPPAVVQAPALQENESTFGLSYHGSGDPYVAPATT